MIKRNVLFVLGFFYTLIFAKPTPLLIIDTSGNNAYVYHNLVQQLTLNGIKPLLLPFYNVTKDITDQYKALFILFDGFFLQTLFDELQDHKTIKNPLILSIFSLIKHYTQKKDHFLGIALPPQTHPALLPLIMQLLKECNAIKKDQTELELYCIDYLKALLLSDSNKSSLYHTSLLLPRTLSFEAQQRLIINPAPAFGDTIIAMVPNSDDSYDPALQHLMSMGIVLQNHLTNNTLFITKSSALDSNSIKESFLVYPYQPHLQKKYNRLQQCFVDQMAAIITQKPYNKSTDTALTPTTSTKRKKTSNVHYQRLEKEGIWCAWTGLDAYKGKENNAAKNILHSDINVLWIELNPEWYLSVNAIKKEQKNEFLHKIRTFTKALKLQSQNLNKPLPMIFIGTDLTSNFAQTSVKTPVVDIYNTTYDKIPAPLDYEHFWKPELIDTFQEFYKLWQEDIGNGLAISGIFLDFEMYHAQKQLGHYSGLMDFSSNAWKHYQKNESLSLNTSSERIDYLVKNNLLEQYFKILKESAQTLGHLLVTRLHAIDPALIIAAYDMSLPYNWFYEGIMAGLSSPECPLILATFNTNYKQWENWLQKNLIFSYHTTVVLLSKLCSKKDFTALHSIAGYHDGVWFNRFERLEQSRNKTQWAWDFGLEVTPLENYEFIPLLSKAINTLKQPLL